jgi:hypothetical protein
MFGFQRMAMPLLPQAGAANALYYRCAITIEFCCDTGSSYTPPWTVGCTGFSEQSQICPYFQQNVGDPIAQIEQLRKQLAVAMAGLEAQERVLREQQAQQAAARPERK